MTPHHTQPLVCADKTMCIDDVSCPLTDAPHVLVNNDAQLQDCVVSSIANADDHDKAVEKFMTCHPRQDMDSKTFVSVIASTRSLLRERDSSDQDKARDRAEPIEGECHASDVEEEDGDSESEYEQDGNGGRKPYGGRPLKFKCDKCERRFHAPSHLKRHMLGHGTERPFVCDVCNKGFLQAWHLGRHATTHTGRKPFQCTQCPKSFGSRFEMNTHVNYVHKGIKEHQCHVCQKFFTLKSNLKVHMRKHTGEKPYSCHICKRYFGQRGHLQYHLQKHDRDDAKLKAMEMDSNLPPPLIDLRNSAAKDSFDELKVTSRARFSHTVENIIYTPARKPSANAEPDAPDRLVFGKSLTPMSFKMEPLHIHAKSLHATDSMQRCTSSEDESNDSFSPKEKCLSKIYPPNGVALQGQVTLSRRIFDFTNPFEVKPYICETCNSGFGEFSSLRAHVRQSHERKGILQGKFSCAHCSIVYSNVDELGTHINTLHAGSGDVTQSKFARPERGSVGRKRSWDDISVSSSAYSYHSSSDTMSLPSPSNSSECGQDQEHHTDIDWLHRMERTFEFALATPPPPPPPGMMSESTQRTYLHLLDYYKEVLRAQMLILGKQASVAKPEDWRGCYQYF